MKLSIDQVTIRKYTINKQDTFLVTGMCLTLFIWFFTYYSNNQDLITRYQYEIKNLETQQRALVHSKSLQAKLEDTIRNLKIKLRAPGQKSALQNSKRPAAHMTDLAHKACKTGLRLDSCVVQKQKNKTWLTKQNIVYEMTGTDDQIKKFIEEVQHSEHLLRCTNLTLKKTTPQAVHLACTLQFLTFKATTGNTTVQTPVAQKTTTHTA